MNTQICWSWSFEHTPSPLCQIPHTLPSWLPCLVLLVLDSTAPFRVMNVCWPCHRKALSPLLSLLLKMPPPLYLEIFFLHYQTFIYLLQKYWLWAWDWKDNGLVKNGTAMSIQRWVEVWGKECSVNLSHFPCLILQTFYPNTRLSSTVRDVA